MRIVNLASGSKGNSTLIECHNTKILLDAGLGIRELEKRLIGVGVEPKSINAIVITHEHSDHIGGLKSFVRKYKPLVFAHRDVWPYLENNIGDIADSVERRFDSLPFNIGDVIVTPFCVSHDSRNCQGFTFVCGKAKFSYATDIGFVSGVVDENLCGSKLVFIEANHDPDMLKNNPLYPPVLKARIRGKNGHLSNFDCASEVVRLAQNGTRFFALSHLSEKNNTPELAFEVVSNALSCAGFSVEKDVFIRLTHQDHAGNNFYLKEE